MADVRAPEACNNVPQRSASVKRRAAKTRKDRKHRRKSTPETSSGLLGCCFSPEDSSPEREFWNDVVFVTPQTTPRLSVRHDTSSRHSTLNYNCVAAVPHGFSGAVVSGGGGENRYSVSVGNGGGACTCNPSYVAVSTIANENTNTNANASGNGNANIINDDHDFSRDSRIGVCGHAVIAQAEVAPFRCQNVVNHHNPISSSSSSSSSSRLQAITTTTPRSAVSSLVLSSAGSFPSPTTARVQPFMCVCNQRRRPTHCNHTVNTNNSSDVSVRHNNDVALCDGANQQRQQVLGAGAQQVSIGQVPSREECARGYVGEGAVTTMCCTRNLAVYKASGNTPSNSSTCCGSLSSNINNPSASLNSKSSNSSAQITCASSPSSTCSHHVPSSSPSIPTSSRIQYTAAASASQLDPTVTNAVSIATADPSPATAIPLTSITNETTNRELKNTATEREGLNCTQTITTSHDPAISDPGTTWANFSFSTTANPSSTVSNFSSAAIANNSPLQPPLLPCSNSANAALITAPTLSQQNPGAVPNDNNREVEIEKSCVKRTQLTGNAIHTNEQVENSEGARKNGEGERKNGEEMSKTCKEQRHTEEQAKTTECRHQLDAMIGTSEAQQTYAGKDKTYAAEYKTYSSGVPIKTSGETVRSSNTVNTSTLSEQCTALFNQYNISIDNQNISAHFNESEKLIPSDLNHDNPSIQPLSSLPTQSVTPTTPTTPSSLSSSLITTSMTGTSTPRPICVPTAMGQIVLNSPPIMSTGVSGPTASGQLNKGGYCYKQASSGQMSQPAPSGQLSQLAPSGQLSQPAPSSSSQRAPFQHICQHASSQAISQSLSHLESESVFARYASFTCSAAELNVVQLQHVGATTTATASASSLSPPSSLPTSAALPAAAIPPTTCEYSEICSFATSDFPNSLSEQQQHYSEVCYVPISDVGIQASKSASQTELPIYAKVSKVKTNSTTSQSKQSKQSEARNTQFLIPMSTAISTGPSVTQSEQSTQQCIQLSRQSCLLSQASMETSAYDKNRIKPARPAPAVPAHLCLNRGPLGGSTGMLPLGGSSVSGGGGQMLSSNATSTTQQHHQCALHPTTTTTTTTNPNNGDIIPTPSEPQTTTLSPEKAKAQMMKEVMENKPRVENIVLVKRTPSQETDPHTPKILRRSQTSAHCGICQTMRRPVIKGTERQRLCKSIESLEDVVLDLDIAYEFVRRKNYRTSFIGDVSPSEAKQVVCEDFGDVQTIMKHSKKEPIYALPQPACFGEDTMEAVKRITEKYNTPQRWKLHAKSFENSLQRPTAVTMAGKNQQPHQQSHMVMAAPPSLSAPYTREQARLGLFYRSFAAEICICDCLAELRQRSGPNEPFVATHTGRPLLVFNTGEGRRRRQLELVLADSNTALPLWSDFITYLSEFRPVDPSKSTRPVHQLRLSSNLRTQVLIEYYNCKAAGEFYARFLAITADPSDTLWMVSGDRSSLKTTATMRKNKKKRIVGHKSGISHPLHFAHVTHIEPMRNNGTQETDENGTLRRSRMKSRSSEHLN